MMGRYQEYLKVQEEEQTKALEQQEQERINLEAAQELQQQLDERQTDDIDWNFIVEQVQERQSGSMIRYQTLKKKPVSVAQARKNMMVYLKNMVGYKMNYFKGMSYNHIRLIFEQEYNKVQTLFKKDTDVVKKAKESCRRDVTSRNFQEVKDSSSFTVEALNTKYLIIDWEILTKESRKYWKIIRVSNITDAYQSFKVPTEDMERALWVELKRLYEPDKDDTLWKLQRYMHDPLTWRLYGSCAVHHVSSLRGHDIYMLTEKDYPLTTAVMGLMLSRGLQVEEDSEMARDLVRKIFIEANRPRR
ncbi:hypothetical protein Tco_0789764 [Tanacetum coccineum]